jgi:hypothetical protein
MFARRMYEYFVDALDDPRWPKKLPKAVKAGIPDFDGFVRALGNGLVVVSVQLCPDGLCPSLHHTQGDAPFTQDPDGETLGSMGKVAAGAALVIAVVLLARALQGRGRSRPVGQTREPSTRGAPDAGAPGGAP